MNLITSDVTTAHNSPHCYHGSCSIGIAFYPNDDETFEGLYEKADKALYCIKAHGKKGYCEYKKQ